MQNIFLFLRKYKDIAEVFHNAGKVFTEKYHQKYFFQNSLLSQSKKELNFPNKWSEFKVELENLKAEEQLLCRCFICGKELNDTGSAQVEHYRPKDIYWWLAYDYDNYYLCCGDCNKLKSTKFPLKTGSPKADYQTDISVESPLLINPMKENPFEYFKVAFIRHPQSISKKVAILLPKDNLDNEKQEKAVATIQTFNLDLKYLEYCKISKHDTQIPHAKLLKKNKITNQQIQNFHYYYVNLITLVNNRYSMQNADFMAYWSSQSIKHWGFAQLIYIAQFHDYTIKNNLK